MIVAVRLAVTTDADRDTLFTRVVFFCVFAAAIVVWFGNSAYRTLTEPDEARYAEIAREMLASGDWVTPHLNGISYLEKPPLQYWVTALAYSIFGVTPWAARLWVITLGLLGVIVTWATARSLWGRQAGEYAALILASVPLYFVVTHINTLDGGLAFFMNAALCCFLLSQRHGTSRRSQRHWMWLCWAALAPGFLQKGLVALVLPALALGAYSLLHRRWHLWRELHLRDGLAIVAVIVLPWLLLVSLRNPQFLQFFFVHEHFARYTTTVHRRSEPWWYLTAILCAGTLPWLVVMTRAVRDGLRTKDPAAVSPERLLVIWTFTQLLFFSLSGSQLPMYIVPAAAPLALLAARWLDTRGDVRAMRSVLAISSALNVAFLLLPVLLPRLVQDGPKLTAYSQIAQWAQIAGIAGLACVAWGVMAVRSTDLRSAIRALAASIAIPLALLMCGSNAIELVRGRPGLAATIAPHLKADTPFYCVGMYWHALVLSLQRTCTVVEYRGELELEFDTTQAHQLQNLDEFARRWELHRSAVAVAAPRLLPSIAAAGLTHHIIVSDDNVVLLVKP